jgi:hypothetical protein
MGIRARLVNNIKGLETSAECKTQAAFALVHYLGFLMPLQFLRKVMNLRVSELCLSIFYTTQYMFYTTQCMFYTTQYMFSIYISNNLK